MWFRFHVGIVKVRPFNISGEEPKTQVLALLSPLDNSFRSFLYGYLISYEIYIDGGPQVNS